MAFEKSSYIELGFCHSLHANKGALTFVLHNKEDSILEEGMQILLCPSERNEKSKIKEDGEVYTIKSISFGNKVIVELLGIDSMEKAEKLIPFTIFIDRKDFPEIKSSQNTYYLSDLLKKDVYDHLSGEKIGIVETYYENGAQIILVVYGIKGNFELPFTEVFFPVVDLENKRIEMIIPETIE